MKQMKLYCIPYAGGSAASYLKWKRFLNPLIELVPVELAGRGSRFKEPLYNTFDEAIHDVSQFIYQDSGQTPYAIFGHSMGSALAFEAACRLFDLKINNGMTHLYVSGRRAPNMKDNGKHIHLLPEDKFREELERLGGTSAAFFLEKELYEAFAPAIRSDYRILSTYNYNSNQTPINVPITALTGTNDDITCEEIEAWHQFTIKGGKVHYFEGGHFFINDNIQKITRLINEELLLQK